MVTALKQKSGAIEKRVASLERDLMQLHSFVIAAAARVDPEGEYRPEFVKKILAASKEKPIYRFKDARSFLKQIRGR